MTGKTVGGEFLYIQLAGMARHTLGRRPVFALEQVLGVAVVIEDALLPFLGVMARFALLAKLGLVALFVVILAVALDAFRRQLLQCLRSW